jgi:hypothetical protein
MIFSDIEYKKMNLLRKYIRVVLSEQAEQPFLNDESQVDDNSFPKGEWILLQPGDQRLGKIRNDLYDMICTTYSKIGGHIKISCPASLDRYQFWMVSDLDDDPQIDVAIFGKPDVGGNKLGGIGHDGSGEAIAAYKNKSSELRKGGSVSGVGNWWGEVSGRAAYAMIKRGSPAVENEAKVRTLLAGDKITWHGDHPDPSAPEMFRSVKGWYTKDFGAGGKHTKIILGSPS